MFVARLLPFIFSIITQIPAVKCGYVDYVHDGNGYGRSDGEDTIVHISENDLVITEKVKRET